MGILVGSCFCGHFSGCSRGGFRRSNFAFRALCVCLNFPRGICKEGINSIADGIAIYGALVLTSFMVFNTEE